MLEDYLSLLSDPEDAPLFSEVYRRYQDTAKAAALQLLNMQCDVSDIVDAMWTDEARRFHETKKRLLVPEYDAYRTWIGAMSAFAAKQERDEFPECQEEDIADEELTDFDHLLRRALIEAVREEFADVFAEAEAEEREWERKRAEEKK